MRNQRCALPTNCVCGRDGPPTFAKASAGRPGHLFLVAASVSEWPFVLTIGGPGSPALPCSFVLKGGHAKSSRLHEISGLTACRASPSMLLEWSLVCVSYNLKRLFISGFTHCYAYVRAKWRQPFAEQSGGRSPTGCSARGYLHPTSGFRWRGGGCLQPSACMLRARQSGDLKPKMLYSATLHRFR
jgi:hypothetical protein